MCAVRRRAGFEHQIPDDQRFTTVAVDGGDDPVNLLGVAIDGDDDDVVLLLDGRDWLADEHAVGLIARWFRTNHRLALVGQYRFASGEYGLAMPFPDRVSFEAPKRPHDRPVCVGMPTPTVAPRLSIRT